MVVAHKRASYAEYMAVAEQSELKHEYIAGEIVAMAGGTIAHGRLIGQLTGLIGLTRRKRGGGGGNDDSLVDPFA